MTKSTKNTSQESHSLIAKKDHVIVQNEYKLVIKKGDDLSKKNIPDKYAETLKVEKII
jgi:hypothetical protein